MNPFSPVSHFCLYLCDNTMIQDLTICNMETSPRRISQIGSFSTKLRRQSKTQKSHAVWVFFTPLNQYHCIDLICSNNIKTKSCYIIWFKIISYTLYNKRVIKVWILNGTLPEQYSNGNIVLILSIIQAWKIFQTPLPLCRLTLWQFSDCWWWSVLVTFYSFLIADRFTGQYKSNPGELSVYQLFRVEYSNKSINNHLGISISIDIFTIYLHQSNFIFVCF